MRVLMSRDGPFTAAKDQNGDREPLPYTAPPAGLRPHTGPRRSFVEPTVEGIQPRGNDVAGRPLRGPPSPRNYAGIS
jgi:hypothetical protein